jgi:hypothetical protein
MADQGTPAGEQPAPVQSTPEPTAPQTTPEQPGTPPDPIAAVQSRLDEFGQSTQSFQDEMRQFMASQQPAQDDYYEPEPEPGFDPADPQVAQQYVNQQVQAAMYPQQMEAVLKEYPEIRENREVADAVVRNLQQMGQDPRGMVNPQAVEMAYKAHKADSLAAQQTPVSQANPPQLDPSGASPQQPQEPDMAEQIKAAPRHEQLPQPPPVTLFTRSRTRQ